ncbi:MAG: hypothetical protein RLZZ244_1502, partial [Verrucomicrobiota bacterium]
RAPSQHLLRLGDATRPTFAALSLATWFLFLFTELASPLWEHPTLLAAFSALIALSLSLLLRQLLLWRQSPVRSTLILTPLYLIRTRVDHIRFWPLWELSDLRLSPRYRRGRYRRTVVRLRFGTHYETFALPDHRACERLVQALQHFEQHLELARLEENARYFEENNDFLDCTAKPRAGIPATASYGVLLVSLVFCTMAFASAYTWHRPPPEDSSPPLTSEVPPPTPTPEPPPETAPRPPAPPFEPAPTPPHPTLPADWKSLHEAGLLALARGEIEHALEATNKALLASQSEFGPQHPHHARSLQILAQIYELHGRREEALPLRQKAVALFEKHLPKNSPELAAAFENLALLLHSLQRTPEARDFEKKAAALRAQSE